MSSSTNFSTIQPRELLEALKEYPFLKEINLAVFCDQGEIITCQGIPYVPCDSSNRRGCGSMCTLSHEKGVKHAYESKRPNIYRCNGGLLNFAIPIKDPSAVYCLIGGGIQERRPEARADRPEIRGRQEFPLLQYMETEAALSQMQMEELASRVWKLLLSLQKKNIYSHLLEKTFQKIATISEISAEIDSVTSIDELLNLLREALSILFDISSAALVLQEDGRCKIQGFLGIPLDLCCNNIRELSELVTPDIGKSFKELNPEEARQLWPQSSLAISLPLATGDEIIGFVVVFDCALHPRDILPIELLLGKVAVQMKIIKSKREFEKQTAVARKFMNMTGILSLAKTKEEVYKLMLNMGADLVEADNGSLMLVDETNENLRIQAVKGMSVQVAKSMSIKVGRGIAGKVAKTGHPLLVNNIENDSRTRALNRPRFKSKSFISLPLRLKDKIVGVLNFSDRDGDMFTAADLDLLNTFTSQAMLVLERIDSIERAVQLEELSVTDPLTLLYNRRLLETRIVEELNRSYRLKQSMTVMLIDLDNFKIYNDVCGHLAGDSVLKKVAEILKETARTMDIVTRYGGEEFCILLPSTSKRESVFVAERMRHAIECEVFQNEEHLPMGKLTASIGIASYPEDGINSLALLKSADVALYQAKEDGRNRIVLFNVRPQSDDKKSNLNTSQNPL